MKRYALVLALALAAPLATAATSDEWTFDEWAEWCGDSWLDGTEKTEEERRAEGTDHTQGRTAQVKYDEAMTYYDRANANMRAYIRSINDEDVQDYASENVLELPEVK